MKAPAPRRFAAQFLMALLVFAVGLASSAPVGTSFTYQGTLADAGGPASGLWDLRVTLYDDAAGGAAIAGPLSFDDVTISDGRVTLDLDFGTVFDGGDRWLLIEVREGASSGGYTAMVPRQRLRSTPNSAHAAEADSAVVADHAPTAGDADTLDGEHGAHYLAWSNHVGVPAGLDDGDDDTLAGLSCAAGEVPVWGGSAWECGPDLGAPYTDIVVVGPVGDAAANGAALLAAMSSISTPASSDEARLLLIEPGLYDLGSSDLQTKEWVDVAGAGQNTTVLTSTICVPSPSTLGATVVVVQNSELRDLTALNTCATIDEFGLAVQTVSSDEPARVTRVTAKATVGVGVNLAYGVKNGSDGGVLEDVTAEASGADDHNVAFYSHGDDAVLIDCVGAASGGDFTYGLRIPSSVNEYHTGVRRGSFIATGPNYTVGIDIGKASAKLRHVAASGGRSVDISCNDGSRTVDISYLTATGPIGVSNPTGSMAVTIDQSRVVATGATVIAGAGSNVRIAASQLWGGAVSGTPTCAGVWTGNWVFYTDTCP